MAQTSVHCTVHIPAEAGQVWARIRDFCTPWHPWIATMEAEQGGQVRAFTVHEDSALYRERLTWFSDSDMEMRYVHLEGIAGVDHYAGALSVRADGHRGCDVIMQAQITAPQAHLDRIATGTKAVFEAGLAALALPTVSPVIETDTTITKPQLQALHIGTDPCLTFSASAPRNGALCLFLHGIGGNRHNWQDQLGPVSALMQTAALDFRGYGDSTLGPHQTTLTDYFDDIIRVADHLGAKRLFLCGLSYGAWIATAFAIAHPDRLNGLILSGGCTGMSEADAEERAAFRTSREMPLDAGQSPADFAPAVVDLIASPDASAQVRDTLLTSMAAIPAATYRDALRCFTNPPDRFDFSQITVPVLLMTGEHDRLAPPAEIRQVAERIHSASSTPDVQFETLRGAGHVCNVEAPELYNAPLLAFLRRVMT